MKKHFLALAVAASCVNSTHAQTFSARIINGTTAQPSAYPWMVSLRQSNAGQFCGASLIAPNWVLTAAHCVEGESAQGIQAFIGDFDLTKADQGEQAREIKRIVIHPSRTGSGEDNDIALLELSESVSNSPVMAASASLTDAIATGTPLTVMGWGNLSTSGEEFPDRLNEVKVPLVAQSLCKENYGGDISDNMICAGLEEGGKDSCQGDSGGPLVHQLDGQWHQVGIVSWGDGCAAANKPGVYARVGAYTNWISQVTSGDEETGTGGTDNTGGNSGTDETDGEGEENTEGYFSEQPFDLPLWLDFFSYNGGVTEETIAFVNTSDTAVSVSSISVDQAVFNVVNNGCTSSIEQEQSCDISIQYSPTEQSDLDFANLSVTVSDGSQVNVELYGENLIALTDIDDENGEWYTSEHAWFIDEGDDAYVLNAWELFEGETSYLQAEFEGPGFLEFFSDLPEEDKSNRLVYSVDDKPVLTLRGGERTVGKHTTELSEGTHRITWAYQKNVASSGRAKVHNVRFKPKADSSAGSNNTVPDANANTASTSGGGGASGPLMLLSLLGALLLSLVRSR